MPRVNNSYYAILGILGYGQMSGYDIKMWVDEGVGYFWEIDYKQIYPTLKRFVNEGLATVKTEKIGNKPEKKFYKITSDGHKELVNWLNRPIEEGKQCADELKLKLFFGHHVSLEKNLEHIRRFKDTNLRQLQNIEIIKDCFERDENRSPSWHYRLTTVMNGEITRKANIAWCDQITEYLGKSLNTK